MTEPGQSKSGSLAVKVDPPSLASPHRQEIRQHIRELLSEDFTGRAASISALEKYGQDAAAELVDTLVRKADHPHAITNITDALAEIGRPSAGVIQHALGHITEVSRPEDVYLVERFVDLLGRMEDRSLVQTLSEQVIKLNQAIKRNHNAQLVHCCEAAKVRIHGLLIELGAKEGLADFLKLLGDGRSRVRDGVVKSLARIGDRRAIVPLVRLLTIEEPVSSSGAQDIRTAIREIARREQLTPDTKPLKGLVNGEKAVLEQILGKARNGNGSANGKAKHA